MHKIKKGLKKKIKGKKDQKPDLFDPEQLAKYKKEKELEASALGEAAAEHVSDNQNNEEWKRFEKLTATIDDVLKKTTGDLDRIKSASYYQRNVCQPSSSSNCKVQDQHSVGRPTAVPQPKARSWIDVEGEAHERKSDTEDVQVGDDLKDTVQNESVQPEAIPERVELVPVVLGDELFDTSFVDAISSGEIKLAYIPDSPINSPDAEDPFDTSGVVEVVKKINEAEKKERAKVNLGLAVGVLTGSGADKSSSEQSSSRSGCVVKPKGRSRQIINLLGSFDSGQPDNTEEQPASLAISKTKSGQIVGDPEAINLRDIVREFETSEPIAVGEQECTLEKGPAGADEVDFDEFDELAADSLKKCIEPSDITQIIEKYNPPDPFDTSFVKTPRENHINSSADLLVSDNNNQTASVSVLFVSKSNETSNPPEEQDPFDTSSVEIAVPCPAELKVLEQELLTEDIGKPVIVPSSYALIQEKIGRSFSLESEFDFDPREDEENNLVACSVLEIIESHPLDVDESNDTQLGTAAALTPRTEIEIDPFDTSAISIAVHVPGKSELRQLENELLSQQVVNKVAEIQSISIVSSDDLFNIQEHEIGGYAPLNPSQLNTEPVKPTISDEEFIDPFDTSAVEVKNIFTGKVEIKQLESELLSSKLDVLAPKPQIPKLSLDNLSKPLPVQHVHHPLDTADADHHVKTPIKPLSPVNPLFDSLNEYKFQDPFDTTVANFVGPGKTEIKLLEQELQALASSASTNNSGSGTNFHPTEQDFSDPFDTSVTTGLILR